VESNEDGSLMLKPVKASKLIAEDDARVKDLVSSQAADGSWKDITLV
jgi:hypothetical protein